MRCILAGLRFRKNPKWDRKGKIFNPLLMQILICRINNKGIVPTNCARLIQRTPDLYQPIHVLGPADTVPNSPTLQGGIFLPLGILPRFQHRIHKHILNLLQNIHLIRNCLTLYTVSIAFLNT